MQLAPELVILGLRLLLIAGVWILLVWAALAARRAVEAGPAASTVARRLIVVGAPSSGPPVGTAFALQPRTTIGRAGDNLIVVADATVSGRHAAVALRGDSWWIEDLGSTNGTLVNDRLLRGAAPLRAGDEIQVGPLRLRIAA